MTRRPAAHEAVPTGAAVDFKGAVMKTETPCLAVVRDTERFTTYCAQPKGHSGAHSEARNQLRRIPSYLGCATCDGGGCGDCA